MDGLECKEIRLSSVYDNKDFRIDSFFHTVNIVKNPSFQYAPIGDYLQSSQYGVSKDMNESGLGYPVYRMNEIHNMLCDTYPVKSVELAESDFIKWKLNDGDVLFNRTNSYELVGRTGIYYNNGTDQAFASYLVRLKPDNKTILAEYLVAFLNCKYGIADVKRRARQSINQTNVNPEEVKAIQIPLLSHSFQALIKRCFTSANVLRLLADNRYADAKTIIEKVIRVSTIPIYSTVFSTKSISDSFNKNGRLDAEYYQPKYEHIEKELATNETVLSLCNLYDSSFNPETEKQYKYIELANVGKCGEVANVEILEGKELPSRARRIVKTGQVIISSVEGSLDSCALITEEYNDALCSTGFYVIDSDKINSETLLILFKSEAIQALLKQRCSGTILTAISKEELLNMPLPEIDDDVQKVIASKVQESFALRKKSKDLLECAKQAVEMAIEQGEDIAIEWLDEKVKRNGDR